MNPTTGRPSADDQRLAAYVADLELEVDRLRKQGQFVRQAVQDALRQILRQADGAAARTRRRVAGDGRGRGRPGRHAPATCGSRPGTTRPTTRWWPSPSGRWSSRCSGGSSGWPGPGTCSSGWTWRPTTSSGSRPGSGTSSTTCCPTPSGTGTRPRPSRGSRSGCGRPPRGTSCGCRTTGLGLPAGARDQLFELLYRAAPARAAGLGVGLAVVKLLVEQSGGTLTVDSGEGQGTTFTVSLPPYDLDDHLGSGPAGLTRPR